MSTCYSPFLKCRELERVDSLFEKHVVFCGKMCRNVISNFGFFPGIKCRHVIPLFEMSASSSELIVCSKNTLCFVEKSVVMLFPYFVYFFELFVFVTPIFSQLGVISSEFLVVTRAEQRSLNGYFALKGVKKQHKFPPELDESSLEKKLAEANLVHGVVFFDLVADYVSYVHSIILRAIEANKKLPAGGSEEGENVFDSEAEDPEQNDGNNSDINQEPENPDPPAKNQKQKKSQKQKDSQTSSQYTFLWKKERTVFSGMSHKFLLFLLHYLTRTISLPRKL